MPEPRPAAPTNSLLAPTAHADQLPAESASTEVANPLGRMPAPARSRWLNRALLLGVGITVFALVGSALDPLRSFANPETRGTDLADSLASDPMPRGLLSMPALIGALESPDFRILIHAGDPEPLYTVCTPAGRVLMAEMRADEVYREFPMIDPTKLRVDPPDDQTSGPLMLAWPLD